MKYTIVRLLLVLVVAVGGYFGYTAWQTHLGEQALQATALQFLPLEQALAQSARQGKPVLVDFSAIWCPTCRAMHAGVFTNDAVKKTLAERYVLARVDYESAEAPEFMRRYAVQGFPSLLVLESSGKLLRKIQVNFDPVAFEASLHS
jgi:thiol:disulfide interchange protein